ncbi:MAG: DUF4270 family protein [Paludibacteraceae bacterium]|nr:DUF4270 family protein [Paludibacteraceae bacterium]
MKPSSDDMSVVCDSFHVTVSSVSVDSVFSVTDKLVLGLHDDPIFGSLQVDFLAEMRYVNSAFPDGAVADSLTLVLYYKNFFGDSTAVQELTVYQLTSPLVYNGDYYSNIDPTDYCDKSVVLGRKAYTPYDRTVSSSDAAKYGCNVIRVPMPESLMQELFNSTQAQQSQQGFLDLFPGVYVTNQYGGRCVIAVDSVNLELDYHYNYTYEGDEKVVQGVRLYAANREATQVVHVGHDETAGVTPEMLQTVYADSVVLISSPAGYFPMIEFPFDRIYQRVCLDHFDRTGGDLNINHASLVVEVADLGYDGDYEVPQQLMLIEEENLDAFFHQSSYPSAYPNVLGIYSSSDKTYTFNNMGSYIESVLEKAAPDFSQIGRFVLVPVTGASDVLGSGCVIRHAYTPSGAFFRSGTNRVSPMRLIVTFTNL